MPKPEQKALSPVARGLMQIAAELDHKAAQWEAGDVSDKDAESFTYADGLRDAGERLREFARS